MSCGGTTTDSNRYHFRGANYVPPDVLKKIQDSTPMYIDIYGLPGNLAEFNGIYKRAATYNKKAAWRFEASIYTSDEGPYLWWSAKDNAWQLSFWEEAKISKGANSGGSPLAQLKQDINNPALHTIMWHIAKNYSAEIRKNFVYDRDEKVKAAQSWKEHVDMTEAAGFNRVMVVSKSGGVCYSNTNQYELGDDEFASLDELVEIARKGRVESIADNLLFFGFGTPFVRVDPGDKFKRFPLAASSPMALAQKEWVDAANSGRLWSGHQRVQQDGRTIHWRIVVFRLNNFWIVAMQNQWKVESAAQKMIKIGTPLIGEGW